MVQSSRSAPLRRRLGSPSRSALLLAVLALGGCVYRVPIQQGNFLDPTQIAQLQEGMTRSQVRFLLGTPMLPNAFDADRWDYLYYLKLRRLQEPVKQRLTITFVDDKVARIEKVNVPSEASSTPVPPAPRMPEPLPGAPSPSGSGSG